SGIDARGIQKMLKLIPLRDLALALKGTPQAVLKNIAMNMSPRNLQDLKAEIAATGPSREVDILGAQDRILAIVTELIAGREMFINRPSNDLVY
ncbi:MAG: FliG C-terminal domain-containing protein, partial [Candidatus Rifleibacteriota bacterium]